MTSKVLFSVVFSAGALTLAACSSGGGSSNGTTSGQVQLQSSNAQSAGSTSQTLGAEQAGAPSTAPITVTTPTTATPSTDGVNTPAGTTTTPAATTTTPATTTTAPAASTPATANSTIANKYASQIAAYQNPDASLLDDAGVFQMTNGTSKMIASVVYSDGSTTQFTPGIPPGKVGDIQKYDDTDQDGSPDFTLVMDDGTKCGPAAQVDDSAFQAQGWGLIVTISGGTCSWKQDAGSGGCNTSNNTGPAPGSSNPTTAR